MIDVKQLRQWYWREPFVPFEIVLKDGRALMVHEPGLIGFHPESPKRVSVHQLDGSLNIVRWGDIVELRQRGKQSEAAA